MALVITAALNGRIPAALLAQVPGQRAGIRLASDAAASFGRLSEHIEREYGWSPYLNTAYRTVAEQDALVSQGLTTVSGGRSEHGLGRAGDADGLGGFAGKRYAEFAHLARLHGWYQPLWATTWRPEPWHWEYDPDRDTYAAGLPSAPAPIDRREWDEMASKAEIQEAVAQVVADAVKSLAKPVEVFFFSHDGAQYEAQVDENTYRRLTSPKTAADRKTILTRAGVRWEDWRNLDGTNEVANPGAFGKLVEQ